MGLARANLISCGGVGFDGVAVLTQYVHRIGGDMGGPQELLHVHGAVQRRGAVPCHLREVCQLPPGAKLDPTFNVSKGHLHGNQPCFGASMQPAYLFPDPVGASKAVGGGGRRSLQLQWLWGLHQDEWIPSGQVTEIQSGVLRRLGYGSETGTGASQGVSVGEGGCICTESGVTSHSALSQQRHHASRHQTRELHDEGVMSCFPLGP